MERFFKKRGYRYDKMIPFIRKFIIKMGLNSGWFVTNLGQPRFVEYNWIIHNLDKKSGKMLDVGFGKFPVFPLQMAALGYDVYGIDLVDEMHPIFKEIAETQNVEFVIADIIKIPVLVSDTTNDYDIITCVSTIEHSRNDKEMMKAMKKLLKKDGVLFLTTEYGKRKNLDSEIFNYKTKKGKGWKVYDKEALAELLRGFKIVKEEYFIQTGKTWVKTTEGECARHEEGLVCLKLKK